MPITMPGDPPPNPKYRWTFFLVLLIPLGAILAPLAVVQYHNRVVERNQNETIDALRHYARLQREFFKNTQRYATDYAELGDAGWAQVHDSSSLNPTDYHGYRFRLFTSSASSAGGAVNYVDEKTGRMTGGYALVAMPSKYGVTGRLTFFISAPGDELHYADLGVKTDEAVRALDQYFVPKAARSMKGG